MVNKERASASSLVSLLLLWLLLPQENLCATRQKFGGFSVRPLPRSGSESLVEACESDWHLQSDHSCLSGHTWDLAGVIQNYKSM